MMYATINNAYVSATTMPVQIRDAACYIVDLLRASELVMGDDEAAEDDGDVDVDDKSQALSVT